VVKLELRILNCVPLIPAGAKTFDRLECIDGWPNSLQVRRVAFAADAPSDASWNMREESPRCLPQCWKRNSS
jgi:hypothetical protein